MKHALAAISILFAIATSAAEPEALRGRSWAPLSPSETAGLSKVLAANPKGSITISCASSDCIDLVRGIEHLFQSAGWAVNIIHHGGLGIDGVVGIRIDSCGANAASLQALLARVTARKLHVIDEGSCSADNNEIYMTIGAVEN